MKIIAIKEMSAGNETVGHMWQETRIFTDKEPIRNIMAWVGNRRQKVTLTIPDNDKDEFQHFMEGGDA